MKQRKQLLLYMFTILMGVTVIVSCSDDDTDSKSIIGSWKLVMSDGQVKVPDSKSFIEFKKDGTLRYTDDQAENGYRETTYQQIGEWESAENGKMLKGMINIGPLTVFDAEKTVLYNVWLKGDSLFTCPQNLYAIQDPTHAYVRVSRFPFGF